MTCVKTGCHLYIIPYGTFAYGDAHEVDGTYFFRLVQGSDKPLSPQLHYEVNGYDSWWDRDLARTSTLVCRGQDVISYGYAGEYIEKFPHIMARLS